jgi:phosphoglucosamine mutase
MERTAVGDRYVLAAMRERGFALGGEQSGHVIFMEHAPTGDGTLTALQLALHAAKGCGDPDEVAGRIPHFPQLLRNIRVTDKPAIDEHPVLGPAVEAARRRLGADGRVVVRYSGTEPKARVMIEAADAATVEELVGELVSLFEREIGA